MKTKEGARKRILKALMQGKHLSVFDANLIGKTTEGGRRIRQIREQYPVLKEAVAGSNYCRYYMDPDYLKQVKSGVFGKVAVFFKRLFK